MGPRRRTGGLDALSGLADVIPVGHRLLPLADAHHAHPALQTVHPGVQATLVGVRARQQHPRTHELEVEPGGGCAAHVREAGGDHLGRARELPRAHARHLGLEALRLVRGHVEQPVGGRIWHRGEDDQVSEPAQEVLGEPARVLAHLDHLVHRAEHPGRIPGGEGVHDLVEQRVRRVAQQGRGLSVADALVPRPAEQLVQDGQRVTHRSPAGAHHEGDRRLVHVDALGPADLRQVVRQQARGDEPERVVMGARPDGADDLFRFGGGEDELGVRRRLLDELEQRVEALRRHHVRLVDDVDLVAAGDRREVGTLAEVPRVVDTAVRGGVDLDDVDGAGAPAGEILAGLAHPAGRGGGALSAVEAAGQDAGRGGLPAAARPGEEVGVVDPVVGQRPLKGHRDVVLPDDVGEGVRAVAAVERQRRGRGLDAGSGAQLRRRHVPRGGVRLGGAEQCGAGLHDGP